MGDVVQDEACAARKIDQSDSRLVSTSSTSAGEGAARRAGEAHCGPLQLLRRQRQHAEHGGRRRSGEKNMVQMAEPKEPERTPNLATVYGAPRALPDAGAKDRGGDLADPRVMTTEEPDGGNLLVRIWRGPGGVTLPATLRKQRKTEDIVDGATALML